MRLRLFLLCAALFGGVVSIAPPLSAWAAEEASSASTVRAEDPQRLKLAGEYIEAVGLRQQYAAILKTAFSAMVKPMFASFPAEKQQTGAKAFTVMEDWAGELVGPTVDFETRYFADAFSAAQLQEAIAFTQSPVGQALLRNQLIMGKYIIALTMDLMAKENLQECSDRERVCSQSEITLWTKMENGSAEAEGAGAASETPSKKALVDQVMELQGLNKLSNAAAMQVALPAHLTPDAINKEKGEIQRAQNAARVAKILPGVRLGLERFYMKTYSEEELHQILAYQTGPTGRAFAADGPARTKALITFTQEQIRKTAPQLTLELCDAMSCTDEQRTKVMNRLAPQT